MSHPNVINPPYLNEDPQIQVGKEMYFPVYTEPQGFGGELKINNGVVNNPSAMYQPMSRYAVPMMPQGIDLNEFDPEPMYNHINLGRVQGNDTAFVEVDPVHSQPPSWSYQEDNFYANQFGSEPSLGRDNNMLMVSNNHSTPASKWVSNSIFIG
jgi:hypothetical protein